MTATVPAQKHRVRESSKKNQGGEVGKGGECLRGKEREWRVARPSPPQRNG